MEPLQIGLIVMWGIVFIIALSMELSTASFVSIWFALGALVSLVLAIFNVKWFIQVPVFVVISVVALVISRPIYTKYLKNKAGDNPTNADAIVGQVYQLRTPIMNNQKGTVQVRDVIWDVVSDQPIDAGQKVKVIRIAGNRLEVEAVEIKEEKNA
ncbi:MAG: NfeD family protein [Bacilli bacterium]|jgi:membrane protein implicated in regulation of membrane protease activity|nr:NfeD family protein [Bacilli bacterium]MDD3389052.1 NfeD family protein [Bacilli bacterium]MDD4344691.1 NfeD family protein [Bacilli bacterium]MDD4520864.1 NfeD family protein [Bacilli bacterium]MDY0399624.1 NfeD family protein [Bacilli bacterium]